MIEKKELICIGCPLGCMLTVELQKDNIINISGNTCPRGKTYATEEVTNPMRIVTSTVRVQNGEKVCVSCKTKEAIPKNKIFDVICALKEIVAEAPIKIGDVLLKDIAGTGVEIFATSKVDSSNI